jgi:polyprenyl P-hydroxybenzoate/phenylacrylic acid decarboxylase-like protein
LRIIIGITGASGSVYGWRLLENLHSIPEMEVHLVLSRSGERTAFLEMGKAAADFKALAHVTYPVEDISCRLASGSFQTNGMVIAPCSIHTMSAIAAGITDNLMVRAADVTLKERRRLVLVTRETPLNLIHIRNMETVTLAGGTILPPVPAFYHKPRTIEDLLNQTVGKALDQFGIAHDMYERWH